MGLFRRGEKDKGSGEPEKLPLPPRTVFCRICESNMKFTQCWRRAKPLRQCECCGVHFEDPAALYRRTLPACIQCGEFLEQPSFDYGACDGCASKYELVEGTLPNLLPNQFQRREMDKVGRIRRWD